MKAPESLLGKLAVGTGIAAVGAIAGGLLSRVTKTTTADGQEVYRVPLMTGAIAGTLVAATAGALTGELADKGDDSENSDNIAEVGRVTAVVGVGSLTAGMLYGLAKTFLAPPMLPAAPASSGAVTLPVLSSDSGKTLAVRVGDTIQVQLPSSLVQGGVSPWSWTVPAGAGLQMSQPAPAAGGIEVDSFRVTGPGTSQISATTQGATFVLNVVAT